VPVTVVPSVAAVASLDEVETDDVDPADAAPVENRPASAPRRRPAGRSGAPAGRSGPPRRGA
jgi:hypothetical protein